MKSDRDRCIALAGVFQGATLAQQIARLGIVDSVAMEASIHSLFQIDAASVEAVYGGLSGIAFGLGELQRQLTRRDADLIETTRYVIALLHLERKLSRRGALLERIQQDIRSAENRLEHFPLLHANILAQLADTYSNTISTLKPRIMVRGEPLHLQNSDNVNRIRSLLLAGIRSAMLWRQCGGNRLHILFARKHLLRQCQTLLQQI
jgi:high frequency lysogenization protein